MIGIVQAFSHPWDLSPGEARDLQRQLRDWLKVPPSDGLLRWVAGGLRLELPKMTTRPYDEAKIGY